MSIAAITQRLRAMTGLDLSEAAIARAVDQRMQACGINVHAEYAMRALQQQEEREALIELLVVPETWFFRDGDAFQAVVQVVRQRLESRAAPVPVRILSLPCASGEEAYSIAMALHDAGIAPANFRIEGVDVSARAVELARQADYRANSFRTQDLAFRDRHFDAHANGYTLHSEIRKLVEFRKGNLFDPETASGPYDIIFCRNLMIYFDEVAQQAAIRRLKSLLAADGVLFVGYAEAATLLRGDFESAPFPKAFALHRRANKPANRQPIPQLKRRRATDSSERKAPVALAPPPAAPAAVVETPLLEQARALADRGLVDTAITAYRDILAVHPACAEACFMLGLLSDRRQEPQAAETYLRRAVYLDPNHYEALCHLALLAEGRGSPAIADALRQRAARVYRRRASTPYRNEK